MESLTLVDKYVQAFWDKFELVTGCVDVHRSELKEFMGMIESRSKVEQRYSESLVQLFSQKYDNRSSLVGQLIKAYLGQVKKRAEQTKIFSSFLQTDVANKIRDMLDGSNNEFKRFTSLGKASDRQLDRLRELVTKNKAKHQKKKKQLEEAELLDFVMSTSKEYGPNRRQLQRQKIREKKVDIKQVANELNKNIEEYNTFSKTYQETMRNVMAKYYDLEHERIKIVVDSVLKIQLTEMSSLKNILFEIEEKSRFLHEIDTLKQMKCILKNNVNKRTGKADPVYFEHEHNFMTNTFERINSKELEQVISYGKSHKQILEKFFKKQQLNEEDQQTKKVINIAKIFSKAWNGQTSESDLQLLKAMMDNVFMRKDFVLCMQQLRLLGRFQISQGCLDNIVKTINIVLDSCLASKDGYASKQIMVLVFTYFVLISNEPSLNTQVVETKKQNSIQQTEKTQKVAKPLENESTEGTASDNQENNSVKQAAETTPQTQGTKETQAQQQIKVQPSKQVQKITIPEPAPEITENKPSKVTKVFLQHYVKNHPIWAQKDFWDSSFVESIYEQSRQLAKNQPDMIVRGSGGFEHEQNLVFNQLAYYVHNMVLFSFPQKQVRAFANKFIKMYSLDEARTSYIYNNIENSLKEEQAQKKKKDRSEKDHKQVQQDKQEDTSPIRQQPRQSRFMSSIRKMFE